MEPFWATIIVALISASIPAYASIRINKANNATNLERIDSELSRIKYK